MFEKRETGRSVAPKITGVQITPSASYASARSYVAHDYFLPRMSKALVAMRSHSFSPSALSASGTVPKNARGFSGLAQPVPWNLERPTHEQLNSPMIHRVLSGVLSSSTGMKSPVHTNGSGSSARPKEGMILGMSFTVNFLIRSAYSGASGPK